MVASGERIGRFPEDEWFRGNGCGSRREMDGRLRMTSPSLPFQAVSQIPLHDGLGNGAAPERRYLQRGVERRKAGDHGSPALLLQSGWDGGGFLLFFFVSFFFPRLPRIRVLCFLSSFLELDL